MIFTEKPNEIGGSCRQPDKRRKALAPFFLLNWNHESGRDDDH
jgi:hypothetical protein